MKNKIIFIPGWMDTVKNRVDWPGLDIWKEKINPEIKIDSEYVVGHSAGANWALLNWDKNRNTKLILVAPGISRRSLLNWFWRWARFMFSEGTKISQKRIQCFWRFPQGMVLLIKLLSKDVIKIVDEISKEDIVIIRGRDDKYFFSKEALEIVKSKGIKVIEIDGVGHNWDEKVALEIEKIVSS